MKLKILIVDDNRDMTRFLERLIRSELQLEALSADSAESALLILEENIIHCVLADMKMPGMDGMELLQIVKKKYPTLPVIIMTAYGAVETAVESMKEGAYDFITKPFEEERLLHTVRRALEHQRLLQRNMELERRIRENRRDGSHNGRDRDGQGTGGPHDPQPQQQDGQTVCHGQLPCHTRDHIGKRTFRLSQRRIYRRQLRQRRTLSGGRGRDLVPG
jgi:FixJ family two-component response regulator